MRRFENQVHDREILRAMLDNILVVHVGLNDGPYPYVVPMSFGYEMTEEHLVVYLHSAREGHKVDLWTRNLRVSLTFSTFTNHPGHLYRGAMHDFRCVMANGVIRRIIRPDSGGQHGRAVQVLLRHNGRRPNQFSVPHYRFMDVYAVECSWQHVTAKSEEPLLHAGEVPFPSLEAIRQSAEAPYDYSYFLCRKAYPDSACALAPVPCEADLPELTEVPLPAESERELRLGFQWEPAAEQLDLDVLAVLLDRSGQVRRRYDAAFYHQRPDQSGAVCHLGDDRTGVRGREELSVRLERVPEACGQIVFLAAIYEAGSRGQDLGMVSRLQVALDGAVRYAVPCVWRGRQAAAAARLVRQADGRWSLCGPDGTALAGWRITEIFAHYGLERWRE